MNWKIGQKKSSKMKSGEMKDRNIKKRGKSTGTS